MDGTLKKGMRKRRLLLTGTLLAMMVGSAVTVQTRIAHGAVLGASNNTLTIGWEVETKTLDPAGNTQNPDIWVQVNIFDHLVRVAPNGKDILPDLASSWSSSNGGKTYVFNLRSGAKFQDGTPITAKDVVFCLNRARQPKRLWAWTLTAIKSVTAMGTNKVKIQLKHPWGPFLSDVSLFDTGIYPQAYFNKVGASGMATHPIGSGAYQFVTWKKGQYLLLKKFPGYFDAKKYPMQQVEYELIPNDNTRLLQTEAGQLDVDNSLAPNQIQAVQGSGGKAVVKIDPSTETLYIVPYDKLPQFADVNVRQAINHAINRAALIKAVQFGHGTPASSFMPQGALDWNRSLKAPKYSVALAKQYLAKSKYPKGFTMTMEEDSGNSQDQQIDVILKSELAAIGITLNIRPEDPTTLFNNQQHGKYHMSNNLWTNDIPDPDELVSFSVNSKLGSHSFYTWYNNPTLTNLSIKAEETNNQAARKADYLKIQKIFMQQVPFFPLFYVPFINAVSSHVHGFSENPLGYFNLEGVTKS
jgi:peptide/nickel transport system substrate-binding protein